VVTPRSALPLWDGEKLTIEVRVREIDDSGTTWLHPEPALKRSADGLFVEIELARLLVDRDGDGLADIHEASIGLAIDDPDTDDDGMADAIDPLPLTRYDPNAPRAAVRAAFEILGRNIGARSHPILNEDAGAADAAIAGTLEGARDPYGAWHAGGEDVHTDVLVAYDPSLFAGVRTPFRLMVYSPADLEALRANGERLRPPRLDELFSSRDGRNHYVGWADGAVGGEYILRCDEAGCVTEDFGWSIGH
jgi:hypothetical protein